MQTEAVFENVQERIIEEIKHAKKSIYAVIDNLKNSILFNELINKGKEGCSVSIIIYIDSINNDVSIDFHGLVTNNVNIYKIENSKPGSGHANYCVIDYSKVITGSYSWNTDLESSFVNAIITSHDTSLAEQFISNFNKTKNKYSTNDPKEEIDFPLNKIIKRLEILKNYILLEDIKELNKETLKLKEFEFNSDLSEIVDAINKSQFALAISRIQIFVSQNQQISIWTDPELLALKLEIKNLENQLNAFDNEKIELEKLLIQFQHRHTIELGKIILNILNLRKQKVKTDKSKYEEATKDENQYRQQFDSEIKRLVIELTDEQKKELKKKFRKATVLCHPDKVSDEFKEAAQRIFIELKQAYDDNDLAKVSAILEDLEKGNYFKPRSETISAKDILKVAITRLKTQIDNLEKEIIAIKQSETYKTIIRIMDWDDYFRKTKLKLEKELEQLQFEVKSNH